MGKIMLREICHARSGDKGNIANIGLIVYDRRHYDHVKKRVTADSVKAFFGDAVKGRVDRYELTRLGALNFVMHEALDGGATRSLTLDPFGKVVSSILLAMEIEAPDAG